MLSRIQELQKIDLNNQKAILALLKELEHDARDTAEQLTIEEIETLLNAWTSMQKSKKSNPVILAVLCALYERECIQPTLSIFSTLIHTAIKKGMLLNKVFKYLDDQRGIYSHTFGMKMVGYDLGPKNGTNFIRFLRSLIDNGVPMKYVIRHLKLTSSHADRFDSLMTRDNPEALEDFVNLICYMCDRGVPAVDLRELIEDHVIKALCKYQKANLSSIKKLIVRGFNFPLNYTPSKELKEAILADMLVIADVEKRMSALKNAAGKGVLGSTHPIYQLMKQSRRGLGDAKDTKGTLATINAELNKLESKYIWLISEPTYTLWWPKQYPDFKSIQALIKTTLAADSNLLNKEDSLGQTLRAYLYEKAISSPMIILMLTQQNLIRQQDRQLLAELPDKLLTFVMSDRVSADTRSSFIEKSLNPSTPLHDFMRFDDSMPGKLEVLQTQYTKSALSVVVTKNKSSLYPAISDAAVTSKDTAQQKVATIK